MPETQTRVAIQRCYHIFVLMRRKPWSSVKMSWRACLRCRPWNRKSDEAYSDKAHVRPDEPLPGACSKRFNQSAQDPHQVPAGQQPQAVGRLVEQRESPLPWQAETVTAKDLRRNRESAEGVRRFGECCEILIEFTRNANGMFNPLVGTDRIH